jgi:hypothetical protein
VHEDLAHEPVVEIGRHGRTLTRPSPPPHGGSRAAVRPGDRPRGIRRAASDR